MTVEVKTEVKEKATPPTETAVIEKAQKGEKLTVEETEVLKNADPSSAPDPADDGKKEETGKVTPEPAKKPDEEKPADPSADVTEDRKSLINAEVNKPEHLVDLSKLKMTPTELGLYWDLRKARRRNQKIEEELEVERVKTIVSDIKSKETKTAEPDEEDPLDSLKDRDDDDILTVADVKKLYGKKKDAPASQRPIRSSGELRIEKIEADSRLRAQGIDDFSEVVDFAEHALAGDKEAIEILRETALAGGNTAEKTYWLIRGSKAWDGIEKSIKADREKKNPKPAAKTPPKENIDRGKRIEDNDGKMKTTGAGTGAGTETGEYSIEEISNMTIDDIKKLPRSTRQAILKRFGSEPNFNI